MLVVIKELAKINYRIHTDAIKTNLIPTELTAQQTSIIYASEADVLNMALFGMTAKQWRENNPDKKGKIREKCKIHRCPRARKHVNNGKLIRCTYIFEVGGVL